jgi:hypothetical protein
VLKLRRGQVTAVEGGESAVRLVVRVGNAERPAIAYTGLTGPVEVGDEVIVNVEARDLGLGSGGFDILCVNVTRGVAGEAARGARAHLMKLNYTPVQHAVRSVEEGLEHPPDGLGLPVGVLALHGQLAGAAFAFASRASGRKLGYVQTAGGALPGALSETARVLCGRGLIADHVTVAPCFGGSHEAITVEGALHAGSERLGWDAALIGPGPGILGSASALGHGGLVALHNAHAAVSLGCPVVLVPRLSSGDERERHRGLSHHTATVLELLLGPVVIPVPEGEAEIAAALGSIAGPRHSLREQPFDLDSYAASGLPTTTMGRRLAEDELFFAAGLASGRALGGATHPGEG